MNAEISAFAGEHRFPLARLKASVEPLTAGVLMLFDAMAVVLAFMMAHSAYMFVKIGRVEIQDRNTFIAVGFLALLAVFQFWSKGHYSRRIPLWDELNAVARVLGFLALLNVILVVLINGSLLSSLRWAATWGGALACMTASRVLLKHLFTRLGLWERYAFIIGTGANARDAYAAISLDRTMGYNILAFVEPGVERPNSSWMELSATRLPVIASSPQLLHYIAQVNAEVFVALEPTQLDLTNDLVKLFRGYNEHLHVISQLRGLPLAGMEVSNLFSNELFYLSLKNNLGQRHLRLLKRLFDIVCSGLLLVLLSPLFLVLALRIKLTSPGPVFYGHERVGRRGRSFKCFKFRTMVTNSDEVLRELLARDAEARAEWDRDFKLKNDPRITPVGHFLRASSLDELPQLWSVFVGDMSLVGPRPIIEAELERYRDDIDYYLEVRPGITGVWQVSGRNDVDYDQRVAYDTWYVKNWTLWYDIVILFKTVSVVLKKKGAY